MLDLIAQALIPQLSTRGLTSVRIDGRSSLLQRRDALDKFNLDSTCVVMLASIGAVAEGCVYSSPAQISDREGIRAISRPLLQCQQLEDVGC